MLITVSPAKRLNIDPESIPARGTQPDFLDQAGKLVKILRQYKPRDLSKLMGVSADLAELNHQRFQDWQPPFSEKNAKPALFQFKGDVYNGIDAPSLDQEDLQFAQEHLRILSGLYGVLKPLDLIQPYRLEMGTKLPNTEGKDLYAFWRNTITRVLDRALSEQGDDVLINLASKEYFKAVTPENLHGRIITPVFKERKGNAYKVIGIQAKKARGLMTRFIIRNRIEQPEHLQAFDEQGYLFKKELSTENEWVFVRN